MSNLAEWHYVAVYIDNAEQFDTVLTWLSNNNIILGTDVFYAYTPTEHTNIEFKFKHESNQVLFNLSFG